MLNDATLQSIILTSRMDDAEKFYCDTLDLKLKAKTDGALVFTIGGSDLRVAPVPTLTPSEHTVVGFAVGDVDRVIEWLTSRGIEIERFDEFPHEENGALMSPSGARVAWIRDPDGNLLSIVQFPAAAHDDDGVS